MPSLEWKESYSVGVDAVDHEHRGLIDLVNRVHEVLRAGSTPDDTAAAFGDLLRAITSHFALEERFMREHGYDDLDAHKDDHERLLDEFRDIMDACDDAGPLKDPETVERFVDGVERWFTNHFSTHDARLHHRLGDHPH